MPLNINIPWPSIDVTGLVNQYLNDKGDSTNNPAVIPPAPQATQQPTQGMIPPSPQQAQMPPQQMPQQMPQQQMPPPQIPNQQVLAMGQGPLNQQAAQQQMPPPPQHWQSLSSAQPPAQMQNPSAIPPKAPASVAQDAQVTPASTDNAKVSSLPAELQPVFQDVFDAEKEVVSAHKELMSSKYNPQNIMQWGLKNGVQQDKLEEMMRLATPVYQQQVQSFNELRMMSNQKKQEAQMIWQTYAAQKKIGEFEENQQRLRSGAGGMGTAVTLENARLRAEDAMASGDLSKAFSGISMRDNASRVIINKALDEYSKQHNVSGSDVASRKAENAAITSAARQAETRAVAVARLDESFDALGPQLDELAKKGAAKGVQISNMPINKLRTYFSDEDLSALKILTTELPTQYIEAMTMPGSNAQMHEGARVAGTMLMNEDMPYKQIVANYKVMNKILKSNKAVQEKIAGKETSKIANRDKQTDSSKGPPVGTVVNGYKFKGGDPNDKKNWTKV